MTNPELYRETVASNGENLVKGMRMFAEDMAAGHGNLKLRQADYTKYEVGRDMAVKLTEVATQRFVDNITSITPGALKGGIHAITVHPKKEEVLVGGSDGVPQVFRLTRVTKNTPRHWRELAH